MSVSTETGTNGGEQDGQKVTLNERVVERLEFHVPRLRNELLIRFGARCGLRVSEIVGWERPDGETVSRIRPRDLRKHDVKGTLRYFPNVRGKDTRLGSSGPKRRETWVPSETWKPVRRYINRNDLDPDGPVIQSRKSGPLARQSVRRVMKNVAAMAAGTDRNDKLRAVSSHDLRRFWVSHLLQRESVNPSVIMQLGGRERFESIKPYLRNPNSSTVASEMESANWV